MSLAEEHLLKKWRKATIDVSIWNRAFDLIFGSKAFRLMRHNGRKRPTPNNNKRERPTPSNL